MTILTGCDQNFTRLSEEEKERQIDDFIMGSVLDKPKNNDSKYSLLMVGVYLVQVKQQLVKNVYQMVKDSTILLLLM